MIGIWHEFIAKKNSILTYLLLVILFHSLILSAMAEENSETQKKIDKLEKEVERLNNEIEFMKHVDKTIFNQIANKIELDVYATLEFENFENTDSKFDARNFALVLAAELSPKLRTIGIVEFEPEEDNDETEVELDQAWLEYSLAEAFRARFGVVLVPFGRYNQEHFDIIQDLSSRPIVMRDVIPVSWNEAGAGFVGDLYFDKSAEGKSGASGLELNYQFYLINGLTNDLNDTSTRDAVGQLDLDDNNNKAFVGRVGLQRNPGQIIGVSGYSGKYEDRHDIHGIDLDWKFTLGPFEVLGEYAFIDLEGDGLEADGLTFAPSHYRGGYVQANYHFWFDILDSTFLGRDFDSPTFTAVARYGKVKIDDDSDPGEGDNKEERITIGLNYRPVETWAFKFEYQFNDSENERLEHGDDNGFIFSATASF